MRRRQEREAIFGENRCFIEWQAIIFNYPCGDWQGTGKNSTHPFNKVIIQPLYRTGTKINNLPHEPAHMPCNGYGEKNKNPSDSSLLSAHVLPWKLLLGYRDILEADEFVGEGLFKVLAFKVTWEIWNNYTQHDDVGGDAGKDACNWW